MKKKFMVEMEFTFDSEDKTETQGIVGVLENVIRVECQGTSRIVNIKPTQSRVIEIKALK